MFTNHFLDINISFYVRLPSPGLRVRIWWGVLISPLPGLIRLLFHHHHPPKNTPSQCGMPSYHPIPPLCHPVQTYPIWPVQWSDVSSLGEPAWASAYYVIAIYQNLWSLLNCIFHHFWQQWPGFHVSTRCACAAGTLIPSSYSPNRIGAENRKCFKCYALPFHSKIYFKIQSTRGFVPETIVFKIYNHNWLLSWHMI